MAEASLRGQNERRPIRSIPPHFCSRCGTTEERHQMIKNYEAPHQRAHPVQDAAVTREQPARVFDTCHPLHPEDELGADMAGDGENCRCNRGNGHASPRVNFQSRAKESSEYYRPGCRQSYLSMSCLG